MNPTEEQLAQELRGHFERRAARLAPGPLPAAGLGRAVRRGRRQRAGLGLAVLAAAATVVVGAVQLRPWSGQERGAPATSGTATPSTTPSLGSPSPRRTPDARWRGAQVPTAGDRAHDAGWLAAANARIRQLRTGPDHPPIAPGRLHLIFAGRLPVGAAVIAAAEQSQEFDAVLLYSPTGRAQDLEYRPTAVRGPLPGLLPPGGPMGTEVSVSFRAPDGSRVFAVVPFDGRRVEVSPGPQLDPAGRVSRSWTAVPMSAGAAVGRLSPAELQLPAVRIDGRPVRFLGTERAMSRASWVRFVERLARRWATPGGPKLVGYAFSQLSLAVDLDSATIEPILQTRERPADRDVLVAVVHLAGGGALQVVATSQDRVPGLPQVTSLLAGRPVAGHSGTAPVGWLEDLSGAGDGVRGRARVLARGAARVEVRDVGARPCTPGDHRLGHAVPAPDGLATVTVELPARCQDRPAHDPADPAGYRSIQVIAFDRAGRELGRGPLQLALDHSLPEVLPAG